MQRFILVHGEWFRVHGYFNRAPLTVNREPVIMVHDYFNRAPLTVNREPVIMALAAPKINWVDFCHDSAITKQALMALAAPKIENFVW